MEDEFRRSRSELSDVRSRRLLLISYYCFLSLSLSHRDRESDEFGAKKERKMLQREREMKQKKNHVSE